MRADPKDLRLNLSSSIHSTSQIPIYYLTKIHSRNLQIFKEFQATSKEAHGSVFGNPSTTLRVDTCRGNDAVTKIPCSCEREREREISFPKTSYTKHLRREIPVWRVLYAVGSYDEIAVVGKVAARSGSKWWRRDDERTKERKRNKREWRGRGSIRGMLSRSFTGPSIDAFGRAFMNEVPPTTCRLSCVRTRCALVADTGMNRSCNDAPCEWSARGYGFTCFKWNII